DLLTFHVSREQVQILPLGPGYGLHSGAPGAPVEHADTPDVGYGFFDDAPGAPGAAARSALPVVQTEEATLAAPKAVLAKPAAKADSKPAAVEASTLRVSVEKVDQLINLVGELVITQAMLAQNTQGLDPSVYQQLAAGLADLDRNTRDLQESVMSIRMIPMSVVFSRFPRMLRDLAAKLGKKVDFVTQGEATELDKGLVEKITDPLTHLVRNSCDHGIEPPGDRLAKGKPETGTITLSASHQGGSIVIEVRDDGRGLNREKILSKARERGIEVSDQMSDADVWLLIFAPGFSTADVVTDVSGRGVGMDVVKRNINSLGGSVEIDSAEGYGMKVSVRLPLTLAIMDGMSVRVADEVYILPLSSVIESFQVEPASLNTIAQGSQLVKVRDDYMPVVALDKIFQVPRRQSEKDGTIMVVVESDGSRVSLLVDELLGQHQVVVKNLESNYRKVPNISGATILGDGKVALILDTGGLVRRARH
ncbi:MAG: chemotaxis protein CheW, partial [Rhizobacter sp.]